jgi:hypothetical protein
MKLVNCAHYNCISRKMIAGLRIKFAPINAISRKEQSNHDATRPQHKDRENRLRNPSRATPNHHRAAIRDPSGVDRDRMCLAIDLTHHQGRGAIALSEVRVRLAASNVETHVRQPTQGAW